MALTDTLVRSTKPRDKPFKLFDERGLFLLVAPGGGKWWRLKYRFGGKEKLLSLGVYPDVSLKAARERRDEARRLLANGTDPGQNRKAGKAAQQERAANSFEVVGREWYARMTPVWVEHHRNRIIRRFERDIFPWIGGRAISELTASDVLSTLRRIESRGALHTAHRALQNCSQVFRYAVATGRAERDPTSDLRGALPPVKGTHFAAVTEPDDVGKLLRVLDGYQGTLVVVSALKLAPLVFVRPGELRKAEWADIDFDNAQWGFRVTKTDKPHIVPLSSQALEILRDLYALTGTGRFVFPGARSNARPMSDNAVLAAMRRMGVTKEEMCGHGFRAMARTILDERLGFRVDVIEHQLAHAVKDANGTSYNRTAHLEDRRKMMQTWADYLGQLKSGAQVLTIGRVA